MIGLLIVLSLPLSLLFVTLLCAMSQKNSERVVFSIFLGSLIMIAVMMVKDTLA